jgi:hypothetical protein
MNDDPIDDARAELELVAKTLFAPASVIRLDGKKFVGCKFESCTIEYLGEPFELQECEIEGRINWKFGRRARRCLDLLRMLCDSFPEYRSEIFPNWEQWKRPDVKIQ